MKKDRSTPENEGLVECSECYCYKNESDFFQDVEICSSCYPTFDLVKKLRAKDYGSILVQKFKGEKIDILKFYKMPLDLNNLKEINASDFGLNASEFLDLLHDYTSDFHSSIDIFELNTEIIQL